MKISCTLAQSLMLADALLELRPLDFRAAIQLGFRFLDHLSLKGKQNHGSGSTDRKATNTGITIRHD
jgi:hypothetical protein